MTLPHRQSREFATMPSNHFKHALRSRTAQIGLWLSLGDEASAELCSNAGFDWLLIDGEHTPHTIHTMQAQLRAVELGGAHPVVRVPDSNPTLLKQVLDMGAQTILVPMVNTAEQAADLVSAVSYPPAGIRGLGASAARATRWGNESDYLDHADENVCLLVQVETAQAISNLNAICEVDGVHGVFIGPADLSASLGHRGNSSHPEVQAVIADAIKRIVASGKAAGILTPDVEMADRYLGLGAAFVAVGIDVFLLAQGVRTLTSRFGLGKAKAMPKSY